MTTYNLSNWVTTLPRLLFFLVRIAFSSHIKCLIDLNLLLNCVVADGFTALSNEDPRPKIPIDNLLLWQLEVWELWLIEAGFMYCGSIWQLVDLNNWFHMRPSRPPSIISTQSPGRRVPFSNLRLIALWRSFACLPSRSGGRRKLGWVPASPASLVSLDWDSKSRESKCLIWLIGAAKIRRIWPLICGAGSWAWVQRSSFEYWEVQSTSYCQDSSLDQSHLSTSGNLLSPRQLSYFGRCPLTGLNQY